MSIENTSIFATPLTGQGGPAGAKSDGNGLPGGDFMALLFALMPGTAKTAGGQNMAEGANGLFAQTTLSGVPAVAQQAAPLDASLLAKTQGTDILPDQASDVAQLVQDALAAALDGAAAAQDVAQSTDTAATDGLSPADTVRRQKDFMAFLQHLLSGLPEDERMMALDINRNFEISQDQPGAETAPALIATGLTPEEMTRFMEELAKRLPQAEQMMAGMVRIQAPQEKTETLFAPRALIKPAAQGGAKSAAAGTPAGAKLNDLQPALSATGEIAAEGTDSVPEDTGFERILKTLEAAQQKGAAAPKAQGPVSTDGAQTSTIAARTLPLTGLSFPASLTGQIYPDGMGWAQGSGMPGQLITLTGPGAMTSLVGYAPAAAQPHPATQSIALTVGKAAFDGGPKNVTVKLDPAELGRVEIRMEFDRQKGVKAHLIAEKPETYMMLQRDAQVLERALQDAGMNMDNSGLSFELAQDGDLSGDRRGQGNDSGGGSTDSGATEETENIVQARMDWYVDPDTGMTHYDLIA